MISNYLLNIREFSNDVRKHHSDKKSRKVTAAPSCVDDNEQDPDCDDVFLPNIETIERKTKTRHGSLHHSDSRSSGIFSQVIIIVDNELYCV